MGSAELVKELNLQRVAWEEIVERSGHVRYDIVHQCRLGVPRSPDKRYSLESMELRHALPVLRTWSESDAAHAGIDVSFLPETGSIDYVEDFDMHEVKWLIQSGLDAGAEFEFETKFSVISSDRSFDARDAETSWDSYKGVTVKLPDQDRLERIPEELVPGGRQDSRAERSP